MRKARKSNKDNGLFCSFHEREPNLTQILPLTLHRLSIFMISNNICQKFQLISITYVIMV